MTIPDAFERLSTKYNGQLKTTDHKHDIGTGHSLFSTKYQLTFNSKAETITVNNELGHQNLGSVELKISGTPPLSNFKIKTRPLINQLIWRKKPPLVLACVNHTLNQYIEQSITYTKLNTLAKQVQFEPEISGSQQNGSYSLICNYSLVFNRKEYAIEIISDFFTSIIDYYNKTIR